LNYKDFFSGHSTDYARFRPRYPRELFEYLASISPSRALAWDCATGNGQAAVALAEVFDQVIATDASAEQLSSATPHPRIEYRNVTAEDSGLPDGSVDLLTIAQAMHWFEFEPFFAEVRRVLKPGGVIAAWTYNVMFVSPEIDEIVRRFYKERIGTYWPPDRKLVEDDYRTIPFDFEELPPPDVRMRVNWSLMDLLGYIRTWSATQRFITDRGFNPVEELAEQLSAEWGRPEVEREVTWPLKMRIGVVR
jgi:SAM-dependent methyltransferase